MRKHNLALALAAAALVGPGAFADEPGPFASADEKLDHLLASWRGQSLEALHAVWGREQELTQRGRNRVFVFERRIKVRASPFGVSVFGGDGLKCAARFEVSDSDEIVRAARQGGGQQCWNALKRYAPD